MLLKLSLFYHSTHFSLTQPRLAREMFRQSQRHMARSTRTRPSGQTSSQENRFEHNEFNGMLRDSVPNVSYYRPFEISVSKGRSKALTKVTLSEFSTKEELLNVCNRIEDIKCTDFDHQPALELLYLIAKQGFLLNALPHIKQGIITALRGRNVFLTSYQVGLLGYGIKNLSGESEDDYEILRSAVSIFTERRHDRYNIYSLCCLIAGIQNFKLYRKIVDDYFIIITEQINRALLSDRSVFDIDTTCLFRICEGTVALDGEYGPTKKNLISAIVKLIAKSDENLVLNRSSLGAFMNAVPVLSKGPDNCTTMVSIVVRLLRESPTIRIDDFGMESTIVAVRCTGHCPDIALHSDFVSRVTKLVESNISAGRLVEVSSKLLGELGKSIGSLDVSNDLESKLRSLLKQIVLDNSNRTILIYHTDFVRCLHMLRISQRKRDGEDLRFNVETELIVAAKHLVNNSNPVTLSPTHFGYLVSHLRYLPISSPETVELLEAINEKVSVLPVDSELTDVQLGRLIAGLQGFTGAKEEQRVFMLTVFNTLRQAVKFRKKVEGYNPAVLSELVRDGISGFDTQHRVCRQIIRVCAKLVTSSNEEAMKQVREVLKNIPTILVLLGKDERTSSETVESASI